MKKWLVSLLALAAIGGASLTSANLGTSAFAASKSKLTGKVLAVGSTALQPSPNNLVSVFQVRILQSKSRFKVVALVPA